MQIFYFCFDRANSVFLSLPSVIKVANSLQAELIIVADGAKNDNKYEVENTRSIISEVLKNEFYEIEITKYFREKNYGLKRSILGALYDHLSKKDNDIFVVIEDDIIINDDFLNLISNFKNQDSAKIQQFSGWFWPIDSSQMWLKNDLYFNSQFVSCWAWGSRNSIFLEFLEQIENSKLFLSDITWKQYLKITHNLTTARFSMQLVNNIVGRRQTWAIYWYLFFIKSEYLSLYPAKNCIKNIGLTEGTNYSVGDRLIVETIKNESEGKIGIADSADNYLKLYFAALESWHIKFINLVIFICLKFSYVLF